MTQREPEQQSLKTDEVSLNLRVCSARRRFSGDRGMRCIIGGRRREAKAAYSVISQHYRGAVTWAKLLIKSPRKESTRL
ncbi:hypothetical protein WA026_022585 [Henosepilachna vigintioctopunctata]|uniref:Ribosomal protein S14 n=1 Tax=Henosepilachna vigintioctopunctata TaxID=420089 RepID=A0AAW1VIS4_9CUCU